jgi:uncharacterized protein (DUF983 family)|tara:strand:- start:1235 stop:1432 length:198 start_codon:yes stop_codon:yes gene_type:complete
MKFTTEIVTGECPECSEQTMLVNIHKHYYRCVMCGEDVEQKVNGVIKYMKMNRDDKMILRMEDDG